MLLLLVLVFKMHEILHNKQCRWNSSKTSQMEQFTPDLKCWQLRTVLLFCMRNLSNWV